MPATAKLPTFLRRCTLEDGRFIIVNLEALHYLVPHVHEADADHAHEQPMVDLKFLNGEFFLVVDDGGWV